MSKKFWTLQMSQGLKDVKVKLNKDQVEELIRENKIIGTGEWPDQRDQCRSFKEEMQIGDVVLVRSGMSPITLVEVISANYTNGSVYENTRDVNILAWYDDYKDTLAPYKGKSQGTLTPVKNKNTGIAKFISEWYEKLNSTKMEKDIIDLLKVKKQIILQGPPGTGKTWRAQRLASCFLNYESDSVELLKKTGQFEIVQFHPSYSYEDFVRGISINTSAENGAGPTYEGQNKIFGDLADRAFQNFKKSQETNDDPYKNETLLDEWLDEFRQNVKDQIDNAKDGKIPLDGTKTYIFRADEDDCLRYRGDNWGLTTGQRMLLKDIKQLYIADASTRKEIKENHSVSGLAQQHSSYFLRVVELFRAFVKEKGLPKTKSIREVRKNYVLLIDEINRANLPAVFGELIYALEYRGEEVSTMYKVDGSNKFVIPPNLYIIGTMNTADRSVGHIDYAIRRRFAFLSIPPAKSVLETKNKGDVKEKSIKLFEKVAVLFDETAETRYLASDFSKEDVQIGHSYFLADNLEELKMKLDYEIKPILHEYVKDGILSEGAKDIIEGLSF